MFRSARRRPCRRTSLRTSPKRDKAPSLQHRKEAQERIGGGPCVPERGMAGLFGDGDAEPIGQGIETVVSC